MYRSELENCLEYRKEEIKIVDDEEEEKTNENISDDLLNLPPNSVNTSIDNDNDKTINESTEMFLSEIPNLTEGNDITLPISPIRRIENETNDLNLSLDNSFDSEAPTQIITPLPSQEEEEEEKEKDNNNEGNDSFNSDSPTQIIDEYERKEESKDKEIPITTPNVENKEVNLDKSFEIKPIETTLPPIEEPTEVTEEEKILPTKEAYEMNLTIPTIDKHINTLIRLIGCNKNSNNKWIVGNEINNKLIKNVIGLLSGKSERVSTNKKRRFDEFLADDDEILDSSDSDDDLLLMKPNKKKIDENKKVNKENELEDEDDSETEKEMSEIDTDTEETTLKGYDSDVPTDDEQKKEEIEKKAKKYKMKLLEKKVKKTKIEKKRKRFELSDNPELPLPKKIKRKSIQQSPLKKLEKKGKFSKVFDDDEDLSDLSDNELKIGNIFNNNNNNESQQQQMENEISSDEEIIKISPKRKRLNNNSNKKSIKKIKKNNGKSREILTDDEDEDDKNIVTPPKTLSKLHHSHNTVISNDDDDIENLDDDDDLGSNSSTKSKSVVELNEPSSIGDISEDIMSD